MRTSRPLMDSTSARSSLDEPLMQVAPGESGLPQTQINAAIRGTGSMNNVNLYFGLCSTSREQ